MRACCPNNLNLILFLWNKDLFSRQRVVLHLGWDCPPCTQSTKSQLLTWFGQNHIFHFFQKLDEKCLWPPYRYKTNYAPFLMCLDQLLFQYLHDLLSIVLSIDLFNCMFNFQKYGGMFSLFIFSHIVCWVIMPLYNIHSIYIALIDHRWSWLNKFDANILCDAVIY